MPPGSPPHVREKKLQRGCHGDVKSSWASINPSRNDNFTGFGPLSKKEIPFFSSIGAKVMDVIALKIMSLSLS